MSRPAFRLSEDDSRLLVQRVSVIERNIPLDTNSHRPFVHEFIRAVFDITGRFYSPMIYHRLLRAHAPLRRPSTVTIASERARIIGDIEHDRHLRTYGLPGTQFAHLIRRAIADEQKLRDAGVQKPRAQASVVQVELLDRSTRLEVRRNRVLG